MKSERKWDRFAGLFVLWLSVCLSVSFGVALTLYSEIFMIRIAVLKNVYGIFEIKSLNEQSPVKVIC